MREPDWTAGVLAGGEAETKQGSEATFLTQGGNVLQGSNNTMNVHQHHHHYGGSAREPTGLQIKENQNEETTGLQTKENQNVVSVHDRERAGKRINALTQRQNSSTLELALQGCKLRH